MRRTQLSNGQWRYVFVSGISVSISTVANIFCNFFFGGVLVVVGGGGSGVCGLGVGGGGRLFIIVCLWL